MSAISLVVTSSNGLAEAAGRMHFAPTVLRQPPIKILGRADVVAATRTAKDVDPSQRSKIWVGWGSNPQPTAKAFGAAPLLSYQSGSAQQIDGDLRILFCLEFALKYSGRIDFWHCLASHKL